MQDRSRSTGHRGKEVRGVTLPRDRLIVALDVPGMEDAKALIDKLGDSVGEFVRREQVCRIRR